MAEGERKECEGRKLKGERRKEKCERRRKGSLACKFHQGTSKNFILNRRKQRKRR
jgi:hypothetical protein